MTMMYDTKTDKEGIFMNDISSMFRYEESKKQRETFKKMLKRTLFVIIESVHIEHRLKGYHQEKYVINMDDDMNL